MAAMKKILIAACAVFFFAACKQVDKAPDVSHIEVALNVRHLERDFASVDTSHLAQSLVALREKYPDFLDFYLDTFLSIGVGGRYTPDNPAITEGVYSYLTYPDYRALYDTVLAHFPNTNQIDEDLKKGFQYMKYYYPKYHVPKIIYFTSFLSGGNAITIDTSIAAIALDMYLGPGYPYYASMGHPAYMTRTFLPPYAVVNVMKVIYRNQRPFFHEDRSLLDMMVQRGKEQYFLQKVLPFVPDSVRIGYTAPQWEWATASEGTIYAWLAQQNLIYDKTGQKIMRYITEGPTTPGMPVESPGNIGTFIGYRIVQAWAGRHPDADLETVLNHPDAQKMLEEARYKP